MSNGNVAVCLAMNEENGYVCGGNGILRRDLLHLQSVLPAGSQKSNLYERAQDGAAKPRTEMERLSHPVICDLAKACKGRLGSDRTKVGAGCKRLQKLRSTHGFTKAIDAMGVVMIFQQIEPIVDVVSLQQAVRRQFAAARAVGSSIRQKDSEAMTCEQVRVSGHPDPVISEAMKKKDIIAVGWTGSNLPGPERNPV